MADFTMFLRFDRIIIDGEMWTNDDLSAKLVDSPREGVSIGNTRMVPTSPKPYFQWTVTGSEDRGIFYLGKLAEEWGGGIVIMVVEGFPPVYSYNQEKVHLPGVVDGVGYNFITGSGIFLGQIDEVTF